MEEMKYPSGGNYPETKEDYVEHFIRLLQSASPQQLQHTTTVWLQSGGKWAKLAKFIMLDASVDELQQEVK